MAFMVICLHVQLFYDNDWSMSGGLFDVFVIYLCKVICPVAVPAFFFFSGYLFFKKLEDWNSDVWKSKITKRIRTLLVPYLLWNLIAMLAFPITRLGGVILNGGDMASFWDVLADRGWIRIFWDRTLFDGNIPNTTNILGWRVPCGQPMNTPMWFVRDLMVVILFSPIIHWFVKKGRIVFLALLVAFLAVDIWIPVSGFSIKSVFFFSWGAYYSINGAYFIESFRKKRVPVAVLFAIGLAFLPFLMEYNKQIFSAGVRMFTIISLMFLVNTVSGILREREPKVRTKLAQSSFFVYCSHMVIIISAVMWVVMALPFHSGIMQTILFIVGSFLVYAICHCLFLFMNKFMPKMLAVLTGGRVVADKTSDK